MLFEKHKELLTAVMAKVSASLNSSEAFKVDDEFLDEEELSRECTIVLESIRDILGG